MLLEKLIKSYEELKKYVYIIKRGDKKPIVICFKDRHFFHLVDLHKTNINLFLPNYIKTKDKQYKYIKKNIDKFNNILLSEIKENKTLEYRVNTFVNILDLLTSKNATLYNLHQKTRGSLYSGDFGLFKIYQLINCLLGLIISEENENVIKCAPQSWMASDRINYLIENRKPIFMENIFIMTTLNFKENSL